MDSIGRRYRHSWHFPHAIEQLGDIVFVELPEAGATVSKGDAVAVFESVKAASDIYSPASGEITAVNEAMLDDLTSITPDWATESWLFKVKVSDTSELDEMMDEAAYAAMISLMPVRCGVPHIRRRIASPARTIKARPRTIKERRSKSKGVTHVTIGQHTQHPCSRTPGTICSPPYRS